LEGTRRSYQPVDFHAEEHILRVEWTIEPIHGDFLTEAIPSTVMRQILLKAAIILDLP
jgi:hypothetical protein